MRRIITTTLALFAITFCFSQIEGKKVKDAITIFDSVKIYPGDTLHFGNGTDRRGDFVYIYQPPNYWLGSQEENLPRKFSNKFAIIKHFKQQKDKRTGDKVVAVINPYGGLNYIADIEGAIKVQEIIAINSRSFEKKEAPQTVIVQQPQSMADELSKLKKLYDDGVLTKDEFDAQKKKLLEKN